MTTIQSLQDAEREELRALWQSRFQREPPARVHTGLMRNVLTWHEQCEAHGIKPARQIVASAASGAVAGSLRSGTRLIREWRGATHEVHVRAQGFDYAGTTYTSLSAIARAITGTPWSGPAFFGLKK